MKDKNIGTVHTIGDSAGGYHALLTGILLHSKKAREQFGLSVSDLPAVGSINLICGSFHASPKAFAGIYFDPDKKLPPFIYDLTKAMEPRSFPPLVLTTGDKDSLLRENRILKARLEEMNIPFSYKEFSSADDRVMHHVFSIAHPTWPESIESMDMFIHR